MRLQFIFCWLSTVDNSRAALIITINYFIYLFMHLFRTTSKSSRADCLTALMALFTWYPTNFRPVEKSTLSVVQFTPNHANGMKIQKPSHPNKVEVKYLAGTVENLTSVV